MLPKSSEFFKRACNGSWKEGKEKTIELPEADPDAFEVYLQLLYTGEVVTLAEDVPPWSDRSKSASEARFRHSEVIIKTYLLADMLMDIKLKGAGDGVSVSPTAVTASTVDAAAQLWRIF